MVSQGGSFQGKRRPTQKSGWFLPGQAVLDPHAAPEPKPLKVKNP